MRQPILHRDQVKQTQANRPAPAVGLLPRLWLEHAPHSVLQGIALRTKSTVISMFTSITAPCLFVPHCFTEPWWPARAAAQDHFAAVLHVLLRACAWLAEDKWAHIHVERFRELVPKNVVAAILDTLVAQSVILRDERYAPGFRSMGYRLSEALLRRVPLTAIYEPKGAALKKKVTTYWEQRAASDLDLPADYLVQAQVIRENISLRELCARNTAVAAERPLLASLAVCEILAGRVRFNKDQFGRFHTSVTNLKREIRRDCMVLDGSDTQELDVSNCQPLLLARLMWQDNVPEAQFSAWLTACESGELVTLLAKAMNDRHNGSVKYSREQVKKQLIVWLFDAGKLPYLEVADVISELFPAVAAYVDGERHQLEGKRLCDRLQRLEASLVIPTVAELIRQGVPCCSVHDSVICRVGEEARVRKALEASFVDVGLQPQLKAKGMAA